MSDRVRDWFKVSLQIYDSDICIACHGVPDHIGIFQPDDPVEWGGYEGKQRYIRYCFCAACSKEESFLRFVEFVIGAKYQMGELTQ